SVMTGFHMPYQSMNVSSLNSGSKRELAESLLSKMGHSVSRDSRIEIFNVEDDGFNLSVKADLMVKTEEGDTIFNFERLPGQFSDILMKRGSRLFYLSEEEGKRKTIKSVLSALGSSFVFDTYRFSFSAADGQNICEISFRALKIESGGKPLYLVEDEMDADIYGLLNGKWKVELIRY
ncbi:MAG: hypothetical protein U9R24_07225, partial [Thermodesulfobacteriota bacterium]|nr:hypothetical protein [Thermodesulfobacteriota bacterium]